MRIRLITAGAVVAAALTLSAGPAAADAAGPGDYRSRVTGIDPPADGISLAVVGGDSFLELSVDPGTEVEVIGYDDEPYLRVRADGTVERNRNSPATYLNDDRYAQVDIPPHLAGVDVAELEPDWETVADGGSYAWHDHRIHWMAPNAPPAVARGETFGWNGTVPLVVDGEPVEVSGEIAYENDHSPLPWLAGGVVVAGALSLLLRQRPRVVALAAGGVAVAACYVAWATLSEAPPDVGTSVLPLGLAVASAVLSALAALSPERIRPILLLTVASALAGWGLVRLAVLTNPVLPTSAPGGIDRATTVAAVAVAVASAVVALGSLAPVVVEPGDGTSDSGTAPSKENP